MYTYKAKVLRVVDGDTFDMAIDVGFSITINHRIRLNRVDCPETWRPKTTAEDEHGQKATEFVTKLILGKEVTLVTHNLGIYGRYSADVITNDGKDLGVLLENAGLVKLDSYPADKT